MIYLFVLIIILIVIFLLKQTSFIKERNKNYQKILVEDSLKHIYDCEHKKIDSTSFSLSGSLSLSKEKTSKLIQSMLEKRLIKTSGNKLSLTDKGKNYALQVIRIHRLWEKFLAENTSIQEYDWHKIAEKEEHKTSIENANKIAAQLGNPFVDPHGDPIPNENGELLFQESISLNEVSENIFVKVEHIEDEPQEVYQRIFSHGIFVGSILMLKKKNDEKIFLEINGKEISLSIVEADNINVSYVTDFKNEDIIPLTSLNIDETGVISFISNGIRGQQRRRLLDFGILPNTEITARMKSINNDPTAYEVRGTLIALRKNQSDLIFIKKKEV